MCSLFRKYAEPGYVQIYTKGEGLVEFNSLDEMEHVIRKLDNTKFDGEYIRLIVSCLVLFVLYVSDGPRPGLSFHRRVHRSNRACTVIDRKLSIDGLGACCLTRI